VRFSEVQLGALRAIGDIGASSAATALAALLKQEIDITVPGVRVVRAEDILPVVGGGEQDVVAVCFRMQGDLSGSALFVLPAGEALFLADRMLGQPDGTARVLGDMERSVVCEAANILTGSYITALRDATGLTTDLSPPAVAAAPAMVILSEASVMAGAEADWVILVETLFHVQGGRLSAYLFILSAPEAMERALGAPGAR